MKDFKHEYLRSRAFRCLSLSSASYLSVKSLRFFCNFTFIEILVLIYLGSLHPRIYLSKINQFDTYITQNVPERTLD